VAAAGDIGLGVAVKIDVIGADRASKAFQMAQKRMPKALSDGVHRTTLNSEIFIKKQYRSKLRQTGTLMKSVTSTIVRRGGLVTLARVGTPIVYAPIHEKGGTEKGGTVRPKGRSRTVIVGRTASGEIKTKTAGGKMLAIPGKIARTKQTGTARQKFIDQAGLVASGGRPFSTFVSKSGKALLISVKGRPLQLLLLCRKVASRGLADATDYTRRQGRTDT
jgi:phage gpG-like protein